MGGCVCAAWRQSFWPAWGAVPLCVYLFPDHISTPDYTYAILAGAVLGAIYITLRPVMKLLLGLFNLFTLGLLYVLLDAWLVQLCGWVIPDNAFQVENFWWALAAALIVNAARGIFGRMFKPAK